MTTWLRGVFGEATQSKLSSVRPLMEGMEGGTLIVFGAIESSADTT
jgi:hypothetical protein